MLHTERGDDIADLVARVVEEYFERLRRGEHPQLEEFVDQYPEISDLLRTVIPGLQAAERSPDVSADGKVPHEGHKQLGDFRILRQIGRGGMGIVYEAEQISMNRRVALKVLPLAGLVDELKIRRFQNEVRMVAALDHPNIVSVFMVGEERGVHYFAMQLIRGRSLSEVISSLRYVRDEGKEFDGSSISQITNMGGVDDRAEADLNAAAEFIGADSHREAGAETVGTVAPTKTNSSTIPHSSRREYYRSVASLGIQAATALQHAHDEGIIHRDIKPSNLLLDSSARLYVTDFGLARVEADVGVTMTGDLIGTLRYMSPEQALAKRVVVDHRADIYSLAATLYELLTLRPAYLAEDRQQLLKQIAFEEPALLRRIDRDIPAELETIVRKAMAKDVEQRYASAQELADDLRSHLENRPIQAKPPTISETIGKWTRRNPILTWAALITLSLVTMTLVASTLVIANQRDIARKAERDARQMAERAREERYVSDMNLASHAWNAGDLRRTQELLEVHRTREADDSSPTLEPSADNQGFEWRLLWGLSHADEAAWKLVPGMGAVNCVAMSPKSNALAWGGADGSVSIVDPLSGRQRHLRSFDSSVVRVAYSIDARWLAAACENENIRLWEVGSWRDMRELQGHKGFIRDMLFHPDGTHLTSIDDDKIRIWDLRDTFAVKGFDHPEPSAPRITVSADATTVATYGGLDNTVRFWRLRPGEPPELKTLPAQQAIILSVVLSSDGSTAFISTHDSGLSRWNLETLRPTVTYSQNLLATNLVLSADEQTLVSTGADNLIRVWDAESGRKLQTLRGHPGTPSGVALAADTTSLAGVSRDGTVRVRSIGSEDHRFRLPHEGIVVHLAVSPDGQTLATADPNHRIVKLWDVPSRKLIDSFDGKQTLAFSPDGKWLALMSFEGRLRLWDRSTTPYRSQTDEDIGAFTFGRSVTFSRDSKILAFYGKNNTVTLWDVDKQETMRTLPDHVSSCPAAFGAYDKVVATASSRLIRIWDVASGLRLASIAVREEGIRDICFSPNGKLLAATSGDTEFGWWDVSDLTKPRELPPLRGHTASVVTVAFSPDGTMLATGGHDNTLRLWDIALERQLAVLRSHSSTIESLAWSPDGNTIYTGSGDASCRIWHAPSWTEIEAAEARQSTPEQLP